MPLIHRLPPELISQIAAGEVVERPASVVKELVENAIDAGARSIDVTLAAGGRELIAVSDDGAGMGPEDARLAFEHHATSKLRALDDLDRIATLGFRGEALPSIAAVAHVRVVTAAGGAPSGIELELEDGAIRRATAVGRPPGTTIEVSRLFHRTPARRKFLRSPATELAKIQELLVQHALAYPEIAFRLVHQRRELLHAPAAATLKARAAQLFGVEWAQPLLVVSGRAGGVTLEGVISPPGLSWPHRRYQHWSVNRRPVRSQLLTHALYDGYLSLLRRGQHPAALLQVTLDPAGVDVNIHPAKLEIRFAQPQAIHAVVRDAVVERLSASAGIGADRPAAGGDALAGHAPLSYAAPASTDPWVSGHVVRDAAAEYEPAASTVSLLTAPLVEPLGQVYQTYIVAVVDGALQLIDQHAAHERLLFDALMAQLSSDATLEAQPRLVPQTVALPADVVTLLAAHLPLLARMGLECEPFGRDALVIRSTPAVLAQAPLEPFLVDLADGWSAGAEWPEAAASRPGDGARAGQRRLLQAVAATIACHGAIKAHQPLGRREMSHLVEELHRRRVAPTCPHGRPVRVSFDRDQLEKLFYRR